MPRPTTLLTAALPLLLLTAAGPAAARTDYEGCVSTELPAPAHSTVWYVPGTGELCEPVDCGGGRAPPKTVPGCPAYKGTETVTPKFWSGFDRDAVPTPAPGAGGGKPGGDGDGDDSDGDDGDDEDGNGVGVGVTAGGEAKGTITVTLGGGAAASRTGTKTRSGGGDVEETGKPEKGGDDDDDEDEDEESSSDDAEESPSPSTGGKKTMATMTKVMTAVETVDGVARPAPTGNGDAADSTVSTAAAVPSAVVAKGVFGVVAGAAAAGLVFA